VAGPQTTEQVVFRVERAIGVLCVVLALGGALAAAVARAGTYEVAICHDPTTGLTTSTDGMSFPTSGSSAEAGVYDGCGSVGYLFATLDGTASYSVIESAAWEFQAPSGTNIAAVQLWRAFYTAESASDPPPLDAFETISSSGAASVLAQCSQAAGCSIGTGPSSEFSGANLIEYGGLAGVVSLEGTASCGVGESCDAGGGAVCPELGGDPCMAGNHLYAMVVTLEDDTPPIAGDVSGTLVAPGVLAGVAQISFDATDTGSGLYAATMTVDGSAVASTQIEPNDGDCVPIDGLGPGGVRTGVLRFAWTVPCPLAGSGTIQLDTRALADGAHSVVVTVSDAAGNTATVWSGTIHTDNTPQGRSTGAPVSGSPPGTAPPAAAGTPRVANGTGACGDARMRAAIDGAASVTIPLGRSVTLRGALDCGSAPIKDAIVELEIAPSTGSGPARHVHLHTAGDGSFAYIVSPGTSRRITLSYREFADDAAPSASASADVLVKPAIALSITPTHTTNGHTITFSGSVSGGDEPRGGLPLDLEYLEGSRWMIYDVVRARPGDGRFTYSYTFERTTESITYTFRVAIPPGGVAGYPYQPSASPARSVHVDP
jgi:hypothetical protein